MTRPDLSVSRRVVAEMVTRAAGDVAGVARIGHAGPIWRRVIAGPAVRIMKQDDGVTVRIVLVARPGTSLGSLTRAVREVVDDTLERLLDLRVTTIDVVVDGVGD